MTFIVYTGSYWSELMQLQGAYPGVNLIGLIDG